MMRRKYAYITTGKILEKLKEEGLNIARTTFYNLERKGVFQTPRKTTNDSLPWRIYSPSEASVIIHLIKEYYGHLEE